MTHGEEAERQLLYDNWAKRLAIVTVVLACTSFAYAAGQHSQFKLASQAYDAAESAARMLTVCSTTLNRSMSVILREDAYLHQMLRELPPFVWVTP